ncbi:hypothetical protein F4860DRAFT_57750 [Xylaria cubensis]|nr:hypothetical protein F4860DRAFT_57750 [Xylaria cubensis]
MRSGRLPPDEISALWGRTVNLLPRIPINFGPDLRKVYLCNKLSSGNGNTNATCRHGYPRQQSEFPFPSHAEAHLISCMKTPNESCALTSQFGKEKQEACYSSGCPSTHRNSKRKRHIPISRPSTEKEIFFICGVRSLRGEGCSKSLPTYISKRTEEGCDEWGVPPSCMLSSCRDPALFTVRLQLRMRTPAPKMPTPTHPE